MIGFMLLIWVITLLSWTHIMIIALCWYVFSVVLFVCAIVAADKKACFDIERAHSDESS